MLLRQSLQIDTTNFKVYLRRTFRDGIPSTKLSVYRLMDRTNKAAEAFNRQFNKFANRQRRPQFFNFLRRVTSVLNTTHLDYSRLENGLHSFVNFFSALRHVNHEDLLH